MRGERSDAALARQMVAEHRHAADDVVAGRYRQEVLLLR
jgi:hypothetical protein